MNSYKETFESWNKVATAYQEKFMDVHLYDDTYDTFCSFIPKPGARILEIGCGPGNITRYLLTRRPDFRIEGIDVAANMVRLAEANNPAAAIRVMDCRNLEQLAGPYDAILCGFVMPYLSGEDCTKLIRDCSHLLNAGGILYCSTIEGGYEKSGYETGSSGNRMFVYYHTQEFLQDALAKNGFATTNLFRKHYPAAEKAASTHLILIARKH